MNVSKKILTNSSGDVYFAGEIEFGSLYPRKNIVINKYNQMGEPKIHFRYTESGNKGMGEDAFALTKNEDVVLVSHHFRIDSNLGEIQDLVIKRFDSNLNVKWSKTIVLPGSSFFSVSVVGTPDNGVTLWSITLDTSTVAVGTVYNDMHILHIDSTGYYSPLSTNDFSNLWSTSLSVYPNPVQSTFNLAGLKPNESYEAGIYDVTGSLLERLQLKAPFKVDAQHLEKGAYMLILQDNKGSRITRKFIRN